MRAASSARAAPYADTPTARTPAARPDAHSRSVQPTPADDASALWIRGENDAHSTPAQSRQASSASTGTVLQRGASGDSSAMLGADSPRRTPSTYLQSTLAQLKHMNTPA